MAQVYISPDGSVFKSLQQELINSIRILVIIYYNILVIYYNILYYNIYTNILVYYTNIPYYNIYTNILIYTNI